MKHTDLQSNSENLGKDLMRDEEQFRIITKNIIDSIGILDRNGKFIYISPNNEKTAGWKSEE